MRRISITLENYDDSKIVCASALEPAEESSSMLNLLGRAGIDFSLEDVRGDLFDFLLDDGSRYIELALRTKTEVEQWIYKEQFESAVKVFLESRDASLHLSLGTIDAFIKIRRGYSSRSS